MKQLSVSIILLLILSLSSCQIIGGIFKAGEWVGALAVILVIVIIIFIVVKVMGGSK